MVRGRSHHPGRSFRPFPRSVLNTSISERFESIASRYSDKPAVVGPSASLSYGRLSDVSGRIAGAISTLARYHQGPVALFLGQDIHIFSAMLGVLKSGRSYMPLDPDLPTERLFYMLDEGGVSIVITNRQYQARADEIGRGKLNTILIEDVIHGPGEAVDHTPGPNCEALALYTSGSTGRPKAFVHTHANILQDTMHYTNSGHFCAEDRFLLVSSFSFTDSVRTIYGALLNGACLYPFAVGDKGLPGLRDWILENEITIYRSVPTLFRQFAGILDQGIQFPALRLIYLSGEPVYKSDFNLFKDHFPDDCILVNRLGTSEALTFRCYFIDKDTSIESGHIPVGYEVPDKDVLLLDDQGTPLQQPGIGEIAVRSSYLSSGYLNNPHLNNSVFISDPGGSDMRVYRTGDMGELLADGCLIHLGRKDFQIKIRGYRVELGEVENTLLEYPDVREAVATASRDDHNDVDLSVYITVRDDAKLSVSQLTEFAKAKLPHYMVPTRFLVLPKLPLTTTGKLDRKALPRLARTRPELDYPLIEARTAVEHALADIWREVLGLEEVGIRDEFVHLGGDSIRAMRIIQRVLDNFGINFSMKDILLEAPTIADMSEIIEAL